MILFINACVRKESRTKRLADRLLSKMDDSVEEVVLSRVDFPVADGDFLRKRDRLIAAGDYDDPMFDMARQFARADEIVIAAPYWDLSFPASLKQYVEQINVTGITFRYTPEGYPVGLCRAKRVTYVTTAGGEFVPWEFGPGYIESLARNFYGIPSFRVIKASGLDVYGAVPEAILSAAMEDIDAEED